MRNPFRKKSPLQPPQPVLCARCGAATWEETRVELAGSQYHATCVAQIVRGNHPAVDLDRATNNQKEQS